MVFQKYFSAQNKTENDTATVKESRTILIISFSQINVTVKIVLLNFSATVSHFVAPYLPLFVY